MKSYSAAWAWDGADCQVNHNKTICAVWRVYKGGVNCCRFTAKAWRLRLVICLHGCARMCGQAVDDRLQDVFPTPPHFSLHDRIHSSSCSICYISARVSPWRLYKAQSLSFILVLSAYPGRHAPRQRVAIDCLTYCLWCRNRLRKQMNLHIVVKLTTVL